MIQEARHCIKFCKQHGPYKAQLSCWSAWWTYSRTPDSKKCWPSFVHPTGFSISQQTLELADMWCTHRHRWFAVLTAPPIGQCPIPPLPPTKSWKTIGKVMPNWQNWPEDQHEQLQLTLYELDKFHRYVKGGVERCYVDDAKILPTCLHSAGNQLYPCRCGCRGPLSIERLSDRGLYGVLVPLKDTVFHEGINMRQARYLHPAEMYLLNGGDPTLSFGSDLRLALAAIGQCVAPIQAVWVSCQYQVCCRAFFIAAVLWPTWSSS